MNPPDDRHSGEKPDANPRAPSPNFRYLCERAWQLGYGTIRGLHVRAGDPLLEPAPELVRMARCDSSKPGRDESSCLTFGFKPEHFVLQQHLATIRDGVIDVIKGHDRLPVCLEMREEF